MIVHKFLEIVGGCGWLWVNSWVIVGDSVSFPGWLWMIVGDRGWLWVVMGDCA